MEPETEASPDACSALLVLKPEIAVRLDSGGQAAHTDPDSVTL